jgi:HEAT repeat protein
LEVTERRRAVALAGHLGDLAGARAGVADDDPTVRVTALGALDRLGVLTGDDLRTALADPTPPVRRRACELAAKVPAVDLAPSLADPDPSVVEMAAWSVGERRDISAVPALI